MIITRLIGGRYASGRVSARVQELRGSHCAVRAEWRLGQDKREAAALTRPLRRMRMPKHTKDEAGDKEEAHNTQSAPSSKCFALATAIRALGQLAAWPSQSQGERVQGRVGPDAQGGVQEASRWASRLRQQVVLRAWHDVLALPPNRPRQKRQSAQHQRLYVVVVPQRSGSRESGGENIESWICGVCHALESTSNQGRANRGPVQKEGETKTRASKSASAMPEPEIPSTSRFHAEKVCVSGNASTMGVDAKVVRRQRGGVPWDHREEETKRKCMCLNAAGKATGGCHVGCADIRSSVAAVGSAAWRITTSKPPPPIRSQPQANRRDTRHN